jgi:hypothetical protein
MSSKQSFELAVACDLHAERHLAKAGGSNCKVRGDFPPLKRSEAGVERAERSAEARGKPLAGARGGAPECAGEMLYKTDWGHGLHDVGDPLFFPALA